MLKTYRCGYCDLSPEIETNLKATTFKVGGEVRTSKYKNIFSQGYTKYWSREIFAIDSVSKYNPWTYKINDLNRRKIIGSF